MLLFLEIKKEFSNYISYQTWYDLKSFLFTFYNLYTLTKILKVNLKYTKLLSF